MSQTTASPFEVLFCALEAFGTKIPETTKQVIADKCIIKQYKKGEIILNYGEVCRNVSFIVKGAAVSKFHMYDDERISWIMLQHDVFISILSFYDETPSEEKIEALDDIVCICFSKTDLDEITKVCIAFKEVRLNQTEHYYKQLAQQLYLMHLRPRDRRGYLQKIRPEVFDVAYVDVLTKLIGVSKSTLYAKIKKKGK